MCKGLRKWVTLQSSGLQLTLYCLRGKGKIGKQEPKGVFSDLFLGPQLWIWELERLLGQLPCRKPSGGLMLHLDKGKIGKQEPKGVFSDLFLGPQLWIWELERLLGQLPCHKPSGGLMLHLLASTLAKCGSQTG